MCVCVCIILTDTYFDNRNFDFDLLAFFYRKVKHTFRKILIIIYLILFKYKFANFTLYLINFTSNFIDFNKI